MTAQSTPRGQAEQLLATNLTQQAVDKLDELLNKGRLIPGQRLLEPDLCELLGLGRVPIREALRILAGDGVVELVPGRGARVRRMGPEQIIEMLKVIVGLLFVALDDFPGCKGNPHILLALTEADLNISSAIGAGDYVRINESLCDYQSMLIEMAQNNYLRFSMKRVHFTYYTRQVISYVDMAVAYSVAEPYPSITRALMEDDIGTAKALFSVARDRVIGALSPLCDQ